MALLTADELSTYAPGLSVDNPGAAIAQAQSAVEGPMGANRPLEKQSFTEILRLSSVRLQTVYLTYAPIDTSTIPTIRVRSGNTLNRYNRTLPLSDWTTLNADDYTLDVTGRLNLNITGRSYFGTGFNSGYLTTQRVSIEIEATYTGGLDFTQSTAEINQLKYALGQIIAYQQSDFYKSGLQQIDIKNEIRLQYAVASGSGGGGAAVGQVPGSLLQLFKKYRPRGSF